MVFPFIVMAKGTPDNLRWQVLRPNGDVYGSASTAAHAQHMAEIAYHDWSNGDD